VSTQALPFMPGLTWPIRRSPIWQTRVHDSISGKRVSIADWSYPKWRWELTYSALRGYTTTLAAAEIQAMQGFFNSRQGGFDSFLYSDTNDRTSTGSTIGTGDSTNRAFQLSRTLGGFLEPLLGPTSVNSIAVGSSTQSSTRWAVSYWGSSIPGTITFSTFAPPAGQTVVADFAWAWPVSFDQDILTFEEFVRKIWGLQTVSFTSLK
jgi:uncharacterized protein (TIGR02217 family)